MIQFIETVAGKLRVTVDGTGLAVMPWPGLFMDAGTYHEQLRHFGGRCTTVAVDGPGHGGSGTAAGGNSGEACAQAAAQVSDTLQADPATFVGSSWGGLVGVRLSAAHPRLVTRLVVSGAPFDAPGCLDKLGNLALAAGFRLFGGGTSFQRQILGTLFSPDFLSREPAVVNDASRPLRTADRAAMSPVIRSVMVNRSSTLEALRLVRCPTLVIAGERDTVVPPASALAHSRLLAEGSFEVLPGCGHLAALEGGAVFNQLVERFLEHPTGVQQVGGGMGPGGAPKLPSLFGSAAQPALP